MKKIIIISLIISTALYSTGCYSSKYISKEDWLKSTKSDIKVVTSDSTSYDLREGWYEVKSDTMFIISKSKFNINPCLLYTSDAADERSSVDLGGRRIIKKKQNTNKKKNT